ncbi:MAG TPA: hypothetical protein VJ521_11795, partial [Acidobacteriota bacterium]|nr:hypothetical protein [Acidobacteriota bacterium]
ILAHAPLILPAVIGKVPSSFAPAIPFVIFQLCTVMRIGPDLFVQKSPAAWMWSGWVTGVLHLTTFVVYMALVVKSLVSSSGSQT